MDTIRVIIDTIKQYNGLSAFFLLFLAATIYLLLMEKKKESRMLLLYLPLSVLAVFLFPLTAWFSMHFLLNQEIFYRQLWLIPYGAVTVYALIHALDRFPKLWIRIPLIAVFCLALLIGSGGIYERNLYSKAENAYHLPPEAIEVCDIILSQKGVIELQYGPKTALPDTLVEFNRQYTSAFPTAYGREAIIERWNFDTPFLDAISAEGPLNAEELCSMAASDSIECFVVERRKTMDGDPADYGYPKAGSTASYNIYMVTWLQ